MGGYYGSIQVRSTDHSAVKAAAERVALATHTRMFISPPRDGWIGIYPEGHGQDENIGRAMAELIDGFLLHVMVHHDDVFAYWLFRDGRQIDSFWSAPGEFGEENLEAEERMVGNPLAFGPLIGDQRDRFCEILNREPGKYVFEYERLQVFAELLGIPNALQSYELLHGSYRTFKGDRFSVPDGSDFEELPAAILEQDRQDIAAAVNAFDSEVQFARSRGLLLLRDTKFLGIARGCRTTAGFLVAWPQYGRDFVEFATYSDPWTAPSLISLECPTHVTQLASSASGRRVAISAGTSVQVWDLNNGSWTLAGERPESDLAVKVAISADGKCVAHLSRKEVVIWDVGTPDSAATFPIRGHQSVAFHPNGQWLAVATASLGLVELTSEPQWHDFYLGGRQHAPSGLAAGFGLTSGKPGLEARATDLLQHLLAENPGKPLAQPTRANDPVVALGFTRDGRWLWCSTHSGLHVYEWSKVARSAGSDMPLATWSFRLTPNVDSADDHGPIHAVVEEINESALLFAVGPRLMRLDLQSGQVRELFSMPGGSIPIQLEVSFDGTSLGVGSRDFAVDDSPGNRPLGNYWDIWSLPRLRTQSSD